MIAVYLLNRSTTKSLDGKTPYEAWHGKKPRVHHLHTFNCMVHVMTVKIHTKKLDDRSIPMVLSVMNREQKDTSAMILRHTDYMLVEMWCLKKDNVGIGLQNVYKRKH